MSLREALPALDALVATTARDHHCPSIAWGIVADGALAHFGSDGALHDARAPTEHTVYRIASVTKSFTAAAVLAMRDEGLLALDDPIALHAPELSVVTSTIPGAAPIRIRDLLSMSAGLATDDAWADRHLDITDAQLDVALASGLLFAGEPGATYEYSNLGYGLIGRLVKRRSGRRIQDLITERLLLPLGMAHSTWTKPDHDDWARPFDERDGLAIEGEPPLGDGEIAPMGGIWATVADLATWITWLDDGHQVSAGDDLLSRSSRRELQQMQRYIEMTQFAGRTIAAGYGFGLRVHDDPKIGRVITHSGGVPGYGSTMRWLAGRRFGVIALANVTYAPMTEMVQSMFDVLAEHDALPPRPSVDVPLVHQLGARLIALLRHWDDAVADELFTDNVEPDDSYERRRAAAQRWVESCDGTLSIERVDVESSTSGRLGVAHPSGTLWIDLQIAPIPPPRIQSYGFELEAS